MPIDESVYRSLEPERKLRFFLSDVLGYISIINGYAELLKLDSQKPELQDCIPPEFLEYYDGILESTRRFLEERDILVRSMESLPPDSEAG
jgi:hypothetical protein